MSTQSPGGGRRVWQTPPPLTPAQRQLVIRAAQAHALVWLDQMLPCGSVNAQVAEDLRRVLSNPRPLWPDLHHEIEICFCQSGFSNEATNLAMASADTYILGLQTLKDCVEFGLAQLVTGATLVIPRRPPARPVTLAQALKGMHRRRPAPRAESSGPTALRSAP